MKVEDIIIGKTYKLIDNKKRTSTCSGPCSRCFPAGIKVTHICEENQDGRIVSGEDSRIDRSGHCMFHPDDIASNVWTLRELVGDKNV